MEPRLNAVNTRLTIGYTSVNTWLYPIIWFNLSRTFENTQIHSVTFELYSSATQNLEGYTQLNEGYTQLNEGYTTVNTKFLCNQILLNLAECNPHLAGV